MSRHEIPSAESHLRVVVGWDAPLATFFAHVIDPRIDEGEADPVILWLGGAFAEHPEVDAVIAALAPYAVVDDGLRRQLLADRDAEGSRWGRA